MVQQNPENIAMHMYITPTGKCDIALGLKQN